MLNLDLKLLNILYKNEVFVSPSYLNIYKKSIHDIAEILHVSSQSQMNSIKFYYDNEYRPEITTAEDLIKLADSIDIVNFKESYFSEYSLGSCAAKILYEYLKGTSYQFDFESSVIKKHHVIINSWIQYFNIMDRLDKKEFDLLIKHYAVLNADDMNKFISIIKEYAYANKSGDTEDVFYGKMDREAFEEFCRFMVKEEDRSTVLKNLVSIIPKKSLPYFLSSSSKKVQKAIERRLNE